MNEQLLAQIINGMRKNQQQGAFGNVTNNEMSMFSGNPMNNTDAINAMRTANNTGGAVGNVSNREASFFNMMAGNSGEMTDAAMAQAKQELNFLKAMGQNRILSDDEKARALYLQDLTAPVELLPVDIDGASAGKPLNKQRLNEILERIYQMRGVK